MAVAHNNTGTDISSSGATTVSGSLSVTAGGSNLCAVGRVCVAGGAPTGATVTYNAVSMTAVGAAVTGSFSNPSAVNAFTLPNPATGSNTLTATRTGTGTPVSMYADLSSYTGVDQTTPVRPASVTTLAGTTSSTTGVVAIPSAVSDMTTTVTTLTSGGFGITGTDKTVRNNDGGGSTCFGSDDAAGAATVTHTWTYAGSDHDRLIVGFSIQQVTAGGANPLRAVGKAFGYASVGGYAG